jgi:Domain of unknown function (DUF4177)
MRYRVEVVPWDGHEKGADHLQRVLNEWAEEGWEVVSILPTTAGTSIRSFVSASASADTTEFAIVLRSA